MAEIERGDYTMDGEAYWDRVADAIDLASDQDQHTWLTEKGKRIAVIMPVSGIMCPGGELLFTESRFHADGMRCRHKEAGDDHQRG
jgi:hypothetical protein